MEADGEEMRTRAWKGIRAYCVVIVVFKESSLEA
jgi:hypothetical protein